MRVFVDDSGDFGWAPPQISLHCGVIVCNSSLVELFRRHFEWKKSLLGTHRKREVKATTLTDEQLESFARTVIAPEGNLKIVVVGIDTSLVSKELLEKWRDGISLLCQGASDWSNSRGFPIAERQYDEMSGWIWNRSPENLAFMLSLGDILLESLQTAIIHYHESKFEAEFDDFEIVIDRGFIRNEEHEVFWREFFRTYVTNRSRREPLGTPEEWKTTNHVFERKYSQDDNRIDLTTLMRDSTYFSDSKLVEGLQIADICANICLKYHRRKQWFEAYRLLRRFIVGKQGSPMKALVPVGNLDLTSEAPTRTQQEVLGYASKIKPRSRKH
jgi:hypothetical protein